MQEGFTIQLREPQQERQLVPLATLAYAIAQESLEVNRHAASIGRLLIQAKEQLPDDKGFMEWVQENCRFSHSTALNLMKFARGVEETPALQGHSQSFVLEVLKLPAAEREQFAQEHEGDSVRKIRELIAERDKARQDAEHAEKARLRIEEGFQEASKKLNEVANQRDFYKGQYEAVSDQPPETIEVEVPVKVVPEDYDELKRRAADAESREDELLRQVKDAQARADDAENRAQDAEEEAEKQEQLRRQAQSELRKLRDATAIRMRRRFFVFLEARRRSGAKPDLAARHTPAYGCAFPLRSESRDRRDHEMAQRGDRVGGEQQKGDQFDSRFHRRRLGLFREIREASEMDENMQLVAKDEKAMAEFVSAVAQNKALGEELRQCVTQFANLLVAMQAQMNAMQRDLQSKVTISTAQAKAIQDAVKGRSEAICDAKGLSYERSGKALRAADLPRFLQRVCGCIAARSPREQIPFGGRVRRRMVEFVACPSSQREREGKRC